jgi:hypothetical protein
MLMDATSGASMLALEHVVQLESQRTANSRSHRREDITARSIDKCQPSGAGAYKGVNEMSDALMGAYRRAPRRRSRRTTADLEEFERWTCPRGCGKVYRKNSTVSIKKHVPLCPGPASAELIAQKVEENKTLPHAASAAKKPFAASCVHASAVSLRMFQQPNPYQSCMQAISAFPSIAVPSQPVTAQASYTSPFPFTQSTPFPATFDPALQPEQQHMHMQQSSPQNQVIYQQIFLPLPTFPPQQPQQQWQQIVLTEQYPQQPMQITALQAHKMEQYRWMHMRQMRHQQMHELYCFHQEQAHSSWVPIFDQSSPSAAPHDFAHAQFAHLSSL